MKILFLNNPKKVEIKTATNEQKLVVAFFRADNESKKIQVKLVPGKDGRIYFVGSCLLTGRSKLVLESKQIHEKEQSFSDLLCKSVVKDDSFFEYTGVVKIAKTGQKSHAYQRDENLLLSDSAGVKSEPKLEILANDVFCTHGATTSYLDDIELFYLQSRGLAKAEIENLLAKGFLLSALDKFIALGVELPKLDALSCQLEQAIN